MNPIHEEILLSDGKEQPISGFKLFAAKAPSVEVIAHSLAQLNRFTGHAARPYSVAEHSLLVADIVANMGLDHHAQRLALMHDAHECMCGDVNTMVKLVLGILWGEFEHPLALLVRTTYNLRAPHAAHGKAVRQADLVALATERRDLMPFKAGRNRAWSVIDTPGPARVLPLKDIDLANKGREKMPWNAWCDAFIERYHRLDALCRQPVWNATQEAPTA